MTTNNTHVAALAAIKATPVGEAGGYLARAFFRDDRRHISIIENGECRQWNNDHGAAELVRLNLPDPPQNSGAEKQISRPIS